MTNDNKISFFCNVLTQAPDLDLAQVVAELDRFGISPKQVTLGDIFGAKWLFRRARAPRMKQGWFATDDSAPSDLTEGKRLIGRARRAFEGIRSELDDDEVSNAARVRKPPSRQSDPLTDLDAKNIVFKALVAADGDKHWVLAEKIKAFGSNVQLRRDTLAQLCRAGLIERTGRNRGTKYRVMGVKDIKPVAAPRPSGPRRDLSGRMKDVVKVDRIVGMRKPDFVKIAGKKKKPGQAKEPS
jgi:hypothetical protein